MNPYCMHCGRHLGMPFHETDEHEEAVRLMGRRPSGGFTKGALLTTRSSAPELAAAREQGT